MFSSFRLVTNIFYYIYILSDPNLAERKPNPKIALSTMRSLELEPRHPAKELNDITGYEIIPIFQPKAHLYFLSEFRKSFLGDSSYFWTCTDRKMIILPNKPCNTYFVKLPWSKFNLSRCWYTPHKNLCNICLLWENRRDPLRAENALFSNRHCTVRVSSQQSRRNAKLRCFVLKSHSRPYYLIQTFSTKEVDPVGDIKIIYYLTNGTQFCQLSCGIVSFAGKSKVVHCKLFTHPFLQDFFRSWVE
jgi:hypothetical protein